MNDIATSFYVAIRLPYGCVSSKKKVWSRFRLSQRRLWNDPSGNKRCNTPHLMDMGYSDAESAPTMIQTRMSVVRLPFRFENFHIFFERRAKTLSICPPQSLRTSAMTKLGIIFARTTLDGVLLYKFRRNRPRESLRSEAIIKKAETFRQGSGSACGAAGYLNVTPCFLQIHRKVSIPILRLRRHLANCSSHSVG